MRFATMVSPDDWTISFGTAGPAGWRYILERCARAGIRRIYWRATSGAMYYDSKIESSRSIPDRPEELLDQLAPGKGGWYWETIDYSKDDTFATAFAYGKRLGLEMFAWLPLEESHGGSPSNLAANHPEWLTIDRSGHRYRRNAGWAHPEVRRWKLEIIREILAYDPDGIMLDLGRYQHMLDDDLVSTAGYDPPAVEAFRNETGRDPVEIPNGDPQWLKFRADYFTQWVGDVRKLLDAQHGDKKISVYLRAPGSGRAQNLNELQGEWTEQQLLESCRWMPSGTPLQSRLADLETWSKRGWISSLVFPGGWPRSDPRKWTPVILRLPQGGRAWSWEPHHSQDAGNYLRQATPEERGSVRDLFKQMSDDKLECGWCLLPFALKTGEALADQIRSLHEIGYEEAIFQESNYLMKVDDSRWDAVKKMSTEVG